MKKTEVYSWRVAFDLKQTLEEAAKAEKVSLAQLLERMVLDWLARRHLSDDSEEKVQKTLHQSASQAFGTIRGGDPNRSQEVRQQVRTRLSKRIESQRTN
jgi:hypothetical protein